VTKETQPPLTVRHQFAPTLGVTRRDTWRSRQRRLGPRRRSRGQPDQQRAQ
jgi:hypothetical protein